MTLAYIDTDVELYPEVTVDFEDDAGLGGYKRARMVQVPDDAAARWCAARDQWREAQDEMARHLARVYGIEYP